MIHHGDCLDVMAGMDPESVDAIVTDPPYGIRFMGKAWDGKAIVEATKKRNALNTGRTFTASDGSVRRKDTQPYAGISAEAGAYDFSIKGNRAFQSWSQDWAEAAYRVAKPSAYLLAFGGTRTVHRMTCALEDAGWIIRDMLVWGYASGFPKGRANLKPAWEPIVMARKPGPLRMLAIDECRIPTDEALSFGSREIGTNGIYGAIAPERQTPGEQNALGRWPANIVLTDPIFDGDIAGVVGGGEASYNPSGVLGGDNASRQSGYGFDERAIFGYGDTGTYSRFFLIPKAARSDREPVLGGLPEQRYGWSDGARAATEDRPTMRGTMNGHSQRANFHPTVKPVDLMRHLVRLVTPTGGTVLDPFLGSGTTGIAAEMEGFAWIGIEREAEYVAIAEARLNGTQKGMAL